MNIFHIITILAYLSGAFLVKEVSSNHPILLVPGFIASQLWAKFIKKVPEACKPLNKEFQLYIDYYFILPHRLKCFKEAMELDFDSKTNKTLNRPFIDVYAPGFGTVDTMEILNNKSIFYDIKYFYGIVKLLTEKFKYTRNVDVRAAPYDFRKGIYEMDDYFIRMKKLIENMYERGNKSSVILTAHSMGNMVVLHFLNSVPASWKNKYIKSFVSISPPMAGASIIVLGVLSGSFSHFHGLNIWTKFFQVDLSSWSSSYQLFPSEKYWSSKKPIVYTKQGNYTILQMDRLFRRQKMINSLKFYEITKPIREDTMKAPNVPIHCVYNKGTRTLESFDYRKVNFPNDEPKINYGEGDGTININSLKLCYELRKMQKEPVTENVLTKTNHFNILNNNAFLDVFRNIVQKENEKNSDH